MKWFEELSKRPDDNHQVLSFADYMEIFERNAREQSRTTAVYLKDLFDFYGTDEDGSFKLFKKEHVDAPPVRGQVKTQKHIYQYLKNFLEEGFINKFILLIGPNGSAKSSLVKKIMLAAEEYSETPQGALYSFSWIFPIENYIRGSLGLAGKEKGKSVSSYALLEDHEISAILNSELRDHPILLIPLETRQKLISEKLADFPEILDSIKKSYLYNGDLSSRNRMIYDALLKNYKGDVLEVLKHIRVERYTINKRYAAGAATIEPQLHVDARLQQITMDRRMGSLPASLQSLNLFSISGEIVMANRGILEFSDLLKRPIDTFKYLLMTMESKNINLSGFLTELDIFFVGSSNEIHYAAFKQHPDFKSFRGRFNFVRVPYLTNYLDEVKIYKEQVENLKSSTTFDPHSLECIALWSVLTRIRLPNGKHYKDEKLNRVVKMLNPLEKALFLADKTLPDHLTSEEKQILHLGHQEVVNEFEFDGLYEGKFGISPREIKQVIYDLASENKHVTFTEVLNFFAMLSENKNEYDFLNMASQGDFHNYPRFNDLLENHFLNIVDSEIRDCLGLVDNRSYEDYMARYIVNITALIKGEKIKNSITGKFETSDMYFVKEFESNIDLKEDAEKFRSHMLSRLGAFALDNPGKEIRYTEVFDDMVKKLKESFRTEQKKVIDKIARNLVYYIEDLNGAENAKTGELNKEAKDSIENVLGQMKKKHHYSTAGAIHSLEYLIKKIYSN